MTRLPGIDVSIKSYSTGHIDCMVTRGGGMWRFTGIYGNPITEKRRFTWELLRRLATQDHGVDMAWLVGGDFNEITRDAEKLGGGPRLLKQMTMFNETLMYCGVHEVGETDSSFTWKGRGGGETIFERLDRFVGNCLWSEFFPGANIKVFDFYSSDNRPLWCNMGDKEGQLVRKGKGRFHFEDKWFMEKSFVPDLLCEWRSLAGEADLSRKIARCGNFLEMWSRERCNVNGKDIERMRKRRMHLMRMIHDREAREELEKLTKGIEEAMDIEAIHWKQQSRTNWLTNGDRSTSMFHAKASQRRKRNEILINILLIYYVIFE
ncbi:hypothetical protein OROHE_021507 [Orobanche hederae]